MGFFSSLRWRKGTTVGGDGVRRKNDESGLERNEEQEAQSGTGVFLDISPRTLFVALSIGPVSVCIFHNQALQKDNKEKREKKKSKPKRAAENAKKHEMGICLTKGGHCPFSV